MSDLTPHKVIRDLTQLTDELTDLVTRYSAAEHTAAVERHAADLAETKAFLAAEGAMDLRRHIAKDASEEEELAALTAEAEVKGLRAQLRALELRIDVWRSFGAAVRAELKTLGGQP